MYMDKELLEGQLHQITDQFNERKITPAKVNTLKQNTFIL